MAAQDFQVGTILPKGKVIITYGGDLENLDWIAVSFIEQSRIYAYQEGIEFNMGFPMASTPAVNPGENDVIHYAEIDLGKFTEAERTVVQIEYGNEFGNSFLRWEPGDNNHTISFDTDGGDDIEEVVSDTFPNDILTPVKPGFAVGEHIYTYEFIGWYDKYSRLVSPGDPIIDDMTVYAKWKLIEPVGGSQLLSPKDNAKYTKNPLRLPRGILRFYSAFNETKEEYYSNHGTYIGLNNGDGSIEFSVNVQGTPGNFTFNYTSNYTFYGMTRGSDQLSSIEVDTTEFLEPIYITSVERDYDQVYHGLFWEVLEAEEFTIDFNTNGAEILSPITTSKVTDELPVPTKAGYTFAGWYLDNDFEEKAEEGMYFFENTTLYAKWTNPQDLFEEIAGRIREKDGTEALIKGFDFPDRIKKISTFENKPGVILSTKAWAQVWDNDAQEYIEMEEYFSPSCSIEIWNSDEEEPYAYLDGSDKGYVTMDIPEKMYGVDLRSLKFIIQSRSVHGLSSKESLYRPVMISIKNGDDVIYSKLLTLIGNEPSEVGLFEEDMSILDALPEIYIEPNTQISIRVFMPRHVGE